MAEVSSHVAGFDETIRTIRQMGLNVEQKHMDAATRAGIAVISRAIRKYAPVIGSGNKGLKRAVGGKVGKNKIKGIREAKAGVAVGKKLKKIIRQDRSGKSGVGVSARNAHWFVLGAGMGRSGRSKRPRRKRSGASTGVMLPVSQSRFVERGYNDSKEQAARKIHDVLWQKVRRDFEK